MHVAKNTPPPHHTDGTNTDGHGGGKDDGNTGNEGKQGTQRGTEKEEATRTTKATATRDQAARQKKEGSQPPAKKTTLIDDRYFTSSMAYKLRWACLADHLARATACGLLSF